MERNHNQNNNGGFILGILVGIGIALLFTTKKGHRLLRKLTTQGWDKLENWEDIIKSTINDNEDDYIDGDDFLGEEQMPVKDGENITTKDTGENKADLNKVEAQNEEDIAEYVKRQAESNVIAGQVDNIKNTTVNTAAKVKTTARHFFRRIPKKG